jgi:dihydrofolate synthase/folylpolyglutamate synthase
MNYTQVIEDLFSRRHRKAGSSYKTFCPKSLYHSAFDSIHIAGTNGKGSVSLKIAKALELSGLKVGLYTSPHLESFCERIVINGKPIEEERVRKGLLDLFRFSDLCFFELATLLAFQYFAEEKVDIAVIEAGVGGREDATNVITPTISIITSIAKDHEEILGPALEDIAYQKAGIIKPSVPVVIGPTADFVCIRQEAKKCQSPLYAVTISTPFYDDENCAIAKKALELLKIAPSVVAEALKVRPPCRFEVDARVVFDVAHNPAGFHKLLEAFDDHFSKEPLSAVVGMSADKDIALCLNLLATRARHLYLVPSPAIKAASVGAMAKILRQAGFSHFSTYPTIRQGVKAALEETDNFTLICGSFYIMKEARIEVSQYNSSLLRRESP